MKKNTLFKIVVCALAAIALTFGVVASTGTKTIDIIYRNIKIMIDGAEYVPTDVNGNVVEPFIYNGTTYLPVRAVANAFDKEVKWDGENSIVYLGEKKTYTDPEINNLLVGKWELGTLGDSVTIEFRHDGAVIIVAIVSVLPPKHLDLL